jgi:hypothetical protein
LPEVTVVRPFQVADEFQLYDIRMEPYANFIRNTDIDMEGTPRINFGGWEPIRYAVGAFYRFT